MRAELHVFDKDFAWQGVVGEYDNLSATRCHLSVGDATFTAPSDLDVREALAAPSSRVAVMLDGGQFVGGKVEDDGDLVPGSDITYTVTDDYDLLHRILGWAVPGAATSAQTVDYWRTSSAKVPAETAFKSALSANVARLGIPVTVATDQGRGDPIELSYRFHPLPDRFMPALNRAGIGISVEIVEGQGLLVDCYEATIHPIRLSAGDGVIQSGRWGRRRCTATRAIGMAEGEGTARSIYGPYVDTVLEAEFGFCGEIVVDARDTDDSATVMDRLAVALEEHRPRISMSLELIETADFSYEVFKPGDRVSVEYTQNRTSTDIITEANLTHSSQVPVPEVTFQLGERNDDVAVPMWRRISEVAAGVRDLTVR